ncbi:TM0106 family RecB-like putative nuclease [Phaeobacter italicus]|uniref:TM0106 family RecB-like putative nuclease n=1 Tax=Phaeobacter italicus TaxID=481446 RepID=UPI00248DDDAB|nr:TM0106 family RecB-like putative nuclease [Phaeobacter italicus]
MQQRNGTFQFSATDLMQFAACSHATALDRSHVLGQGPAPRPQGEDATLLQAQGEVHEQGYLDRLRADGRTVTEIARDGGLTAASVATFEAMQAGADVIYQAALAGTGPAAAWGGWADFLERVERPSALGAYSYEVVDTKLRQRPDPKHLLQLVLYSDLLADVQGQMPERAHVELGSGVRVGFDLAQYAAYARRMRRRFQDFVQTPQQTRPIPCSACDLCQWQDHCTQAWQDGDSLFNVANITRQQVQKLEAAGTETLAALAALGADDRPRGLSEQSFERLRLQARHQEARKSAAPSYELRPPQPGRGFDLLPKPQPGDVFYDIEGDPHFDGGLEYLHGIWHDTDRFTAFWAHDHDDERQALIDLFDWLRDRLETYPTARIYHYAPYEVTALKRLTTKYGVGEPFLDRLLRERRFVDLYAVVRGGVIAAVPNYSIKSLEVFYGISREGDVTTAGGSVVAYERWRETGAQVILDEIEDYNRIDCESTERLRDWLVSIRPDQPWPSIDEDKRALEDEEDAADQALQAQLAAADLDPDRRQLLLDLARFYAREAKPAWWALFESYAKEEEELIDSLDALGGLSAVGDRVAVRRSQEQTYRFPEQDTKIRASKRANVTAPLPDGGTASLTVTRLDRRAREVTVRAGPSKLAALEGLQALHPTGPLDTKVLQAAVMAAIDDQCGARSMGAVDDLLSRRAPRLRRPRERDILDGLDAVAGTIAAVRDLDGSVLPVQGPPGTGKTYVTARAILALLREGKRIGVASNSHEAVKNVLLGVLEALAPEDPDIEILHKLSDDIYPDDCPIERVTDNGRAEEGLHLVGGTVFFFAREANRQRFDYIFVDEAGQVGLANLVAIATAARNLVLVGDPQQLPQVIQGSHPAPLDLSGLEYLLNGAPTIPPDAGVFLDVSRRMHPDICGFLSRHIYDGRLRSFGPCATLAVDAAGLPPAGAHLVACPHQGNSQMAEAEVHAICATIDRLIGAHWTSKEGDTRPLTAADIIVVAPYNLQVNALRQAVPDGVRVGTVDKFQGQEAAVCLVSMTSSSGEEMPRGMEFLLSANRLNVALSRAKALALVFASPRLLEAECQTVEDMARVNLLCALAEQGAGADGAPS